MITFLTPENFLLLLLVPFFMGLFMVRNLARRHALVQIGDAELVRRLTARVSPGARLLKSTLWLGMLIALVVALARPVWGMTTETLAPIGAEVVLMLDVSRSMDATDAAPSRLQRAKLDALTLASDLSGSAIGLVLFAGVAQPYMPTTVDTATVSLFVNSVTTAAITDQGTALAGALVSVPALFDSNPETPAAIVLLTDGEDHQGELEVVLQQLVENQIDVFALGYGTEAGSTIPVSDTEGGLKRDPSGALVLTRLNFAGLEDLAAATNGLAVRASSSDAVSRIADQILQAQGGALSLQTVTRPVEQFPIFLALAALLLLACLTLPEARTEAA